jgi:hypothetical protein
MKEGTVCDQSINRSKINVVAGFPGKKEEKGPGLFFLSAACFEKGLD